MTTNPTRKERIEKIARIICEDLNLCATWEQGIRIAKALLSAGLVFKDEIGIDELKTHLLLDKLDDFMKFPGNLYRAKYIHDHIKDLLTFEKGDKR